MRLRKARADELDGVLALAVAFYEEDGFATSEVELRRNLQVLLESTAARVAVAEDEGELLGVAITITSFGLENGLIAELEDLYVVSSARRQGIAGQLIEDSAYWAHDRGCRQLELVIAPNGQDVTHLHDYYMARNFQDDGRRLLSRDLPASTDN